MCDEPSVSDRGKAKLAAPPSAFGPKPASKFFVLAANAAHSLSQQSQFACAI